MQHSIDEHAFKLWADLLSAEIHNTLTPIKAKRLPPYLCAEVRDKAIAKTLRVFINRNVALIKTFERKQNECVNRLEVLNVELQAAKRNVFKWRAVPHLKREMVEVNSIMVGLKIGLGIISTTKPE